MSYSVKIRRGTAGPRTSFTRFLFTLLVAVSTMICNHQHAALVVGLSTKPSSSKSASGRRSHDEAPPKPSEAPPKHKIEFVNFWGSKIRTDDGSVETIDPRKIPCVETLDLHDGPLPPGAYMMEGKPEFEAKPICRVALNVQLHDNKDGKVDKDEMVRRLQQCIDAGFQTFQLQQQNRQGMELIAKLQQETPSYVETHWSLRHRIPTAFSSGTPQQQQLETRQSILQLLAGTKNGALDSLQLVHNRNSPYALDVLDHLAELQRDGYIRSIGVKGMPPKVIEQAREAKLADTIDFQHQEGNLLFPPSGIQCDDKLNLWLDNVLASSLLTASRNSPLQMTMGEKSIVNEWTTRREHLRLGYKDELRLYTANQLYRIFQDDVAETLQWIALKHRVSSPVIAIRWALECGPNNIVQDLNLLPLIVSSAITNCNLSMESFNSIPVEWRKVFRFELDDEDKEMLKECSAPSLDEMKRSEKLGKAKSAFAKETLDANPEDVLNDCDLELLEYQRAMEEESFEEEKYPEIDFSNKALWL